MKDFETTSEEAFALIIEEFEGRLSPERKARLESWKNLNEENKLVYNEFSESRYNVDLLSEYQNIESSESWERLESKLAKSRKYQHTKHWLMVAAAMFTVVMGASLYYYQNTFTTISTTAMEQKSITMPDGSIISLNQNTVITYNNKTFLDSRELNLKSGEAFFSVVHDAKHPLVIHSGDVNIRDIGTSFNVKADRDKVNVSVKSGIVSFENKFTNNKIILNAGKSVTYNVGNKIFNEHQADANYLAWQDKKFHFSNSPLSVVVKQIESVYGVKVDFNTSLAGKQLTADFQEPEVKNVLEIVSTSLGLKLEQNSANYRLSEK